MEHPAFTIGALCAVGGTMGFIRAGSMPSLIAGVGVGSIYIYSGYLMRNGRDYGIEAAIAASGILAAAQVPRAIKSQGKPLPTGLSVMAIVGLAYYIKKYISLRRALKAKRS